MYIHPWMDADLASGLLSTPTVHRAALLQGTNTWHPGYLSTYTLESLLLEGTEGWLLFMKSHVLGRAPFQGSSGFPLRSAILFERYAVP